MNQFLLKTILLSILFSSASFAAPQDCFNLVGKYSANPDNYPGYEPEALQISYDYSTQNFELTYGVSSESRNRTELYIVDGITHTGDSRWTGDKYTAVCNSGVLTLINVYQGLILTRTFSTLKNTLTEYLSYEDKYSRLQGNYHKI